ncbi:exported protein [Candidatus Kuenenia stuttgartiensis]|nr:LamG-like jellyroll fold domain-containing protein [Candidatus Kuenenia stuttgartiensis]QII12859.1 exported protein [Candidatus Kuenenia stuttgartiensis]
MKRRISRVSIFFLIFAHVFLFSEENFAEEKAYQNIYGTVWNDKPSEDISYARQMGYDSIAINPSSEVKDYHNNPNCTGLNYYLINPQWYPQILSGYSRAIDITKPVSEEAKEFYNQRMVWKSHEPFPYNLATGYHSGGSSEQFYVMWDFQQQAVIDEVVENIISLAKSYEDTGLPFTFDGYIIDEPKLAGEFYRLDETGNNISVGLSYWTGADLGLVHDAITHEYATYSEGMAAFYKELRVRLSQEFTHPKWIAQPTLLYSEADNDEWINQIKVRADKDELTPDMLSQKSSQNTNYVDDANNFNAGVNITKDKVGNSQTSEADEYRNRLFAAKAGINGAWYNWFGRFGDTGDISGFKSITEVSPRLKLIRCLPNWDNLNNVPLSERSWDGSVYQSTNSYAGSDVMYSRHPKTGKLFAVFLTLSGVITLNAGETATSVQRTDGYFIESGDGSADVGIVGNEISLKSKDNIGKGYIFTVSAEGTWPPVETGSGTDTDGTSGLEASDETVNGSELTHTTLVEYYPASGSRNSVSSKKRTKAITSKQSSSSTQTWQQVAKRTQAQKTAGLAGGEGQQMILGIAYAPSNPNMAYFVTDTSQVWKSTDGGTSWQRKANGFGATGGTSVVFDPKNADIAYITGMNGNAGSWTPFADVVQGIFRTADGGNNWKLVKSANFNRITRSDGVHIAFAGNNIYAAPMKTGILKSTNGGTTWNFLTTSGGGKILDTLNLNNIAAHPTDNTILYVSASNGLYKIVDSGGSATVSKIGTGLPSGAVYQLVIDSTTPSTMYVAANSKGVYRSTDGGLNFSARNNGLSTPLGSGGQARYIAMSPVNSSKLIITFRGLFGNYVYHTSDGGANWTKTTNMDESNADGWVAGSVFGWTSNLSGVDNDYSPISFHPTNQNIALTIGWGNQVKKTTDGGVTWKYSNTGYTGSAVGDQECSTPIGWDSTNYNRAVFSQGDFGSLITEDNESTFKLIATVSHNNRKATAAAAMYENIIIEAVGATNDDSTNAQIIAISRNSGSSWTKISDAFAPFKFISFHPQNNNIVYAGKYKFTNIQTNNNYTTLSKTVASVFIGDGDIVYSYSGSNIYKSTDAGASWTNPYPSLNLPSGYYISQITVSPTDENRIYAVVKGKGIYIINNTAANGGTSVLRNNANGIELDQFGEINTSSIAIDPNNANVVYTGTRANWKGMANGLFRSLDGGETWTNITQNTFGTMFGISNITVRPDNSYVYISSFAGTWKLPPPSSTSTADNTAPNCSISINNGDSYTKPTAVMLTLSATDNVGVTGYYISTSSMAPSASTTGWVSVTSTRSYDASVSYNLSSSDGKKTLYAWYKDAAGNVSISATDAITLDKTAPVVTITNPTSSATYTATGSTISLGGSTSDSTSGVSSVAWSNNKGGSGTASGTTSWNISGIGLSSGENVITVTATDGAGNTGTDTITVTYTATTSSAGTIPTVTTGSATDVTTNSATLNGTVNAGGLSTTSWFEYGETSGSYGSKSSTQSASGSKGTTVSIGISGLPAGKTYYYRIAAQNSAGTTYGSKMSFTTSSGTPSTSTSSGLQAFYAFDDGSGTIATDTSGNNKNGTITGAAWTTGKNGGALSFNGTSNYVSIPPLNHDEISVSAWFYRNSVDTAEPDTILGGWSWDKVEGYGLYFDQYSSSKDTIRFIVTSQTSGGTKTQKYATKNLVTSTGKWYHVAGTYDKTTGEQKLYVDGQLVDTQTHPAGNTIVPYTYASYMAIGALTFNYGHMDGKVDEVQVYNRALSDQEAQDLYNGTVGTITPAGTTPTVTTGSATDVTTNSATLNGTVNAGGLSTTAWFEYGETSGSYGSKSSTQSASGSKDTTVSIGISGLSAGKTYYYRIAAQNSAGTTYGSEISFTTSSGTPTTGTSSGLQAFYAFDDGSGTTAADTSDNNKNGTITGAAWTTGKNGGALSFNGTSNYVSIPPLNYDEVSVSAWFYRNSVDTAAPDTILGGWSWNKVEGYGLYFDQYSASQNTIRFIVTSQTSGGTKTQKYATKDLVTSTGKWYHVAGTYNKTTGEQKLYVDGQLVNTQTHPAGNTIVPYTYASYMAVGALTSNYGNMDGKVDEVRVYNRALSDQEAQDLYNGTVGTITPAGTTPTVTTGSATDVTTNSATLNGTVNAGGLSTTAWFEYGESSGSYGSKSSTQSASGSKDTTVSIGISGLSAGKTYYYRIAAQNSAGTTYGSEISFTTSSGTPTTGTSSGLQAFYAFDDGSGTTATDTSGNNKNGTITGAAWTTGKIGGALSFNGTSNYVSIPPLNHDEISVSAWFYRNSVDTAAPDTILGGWSWDKVEGYGLYFNQYSSSRDTIRFIVTSKTSEGTKTQKYATRDLVTSTDKWYHVAGTYNKTTGEQKLYVDGQLVDTQTHPAGNTIVPYTYASYMAVGALTSNYGNMDGKVDEVQVYNRALSDQEIQDLYNGN